MGSRSRQFLTMNISKTVPNMAILWQVTSSLRAFAESLLACRSRLCWMGLNTCRPCNAITVSCWYMCLTKLSDTHIQMCYFLSSLYPRPHSRGIEQWCTSDISLFDVCLTFLVYIGPKSRTERPRKTKIGTEVAHITCDLDTTSKGQRSTCRGGDILWRFPTQLVLNLNRVK